MKKFLLNKVTAILILAAIALSSLCLFAGCGGDPTFEIVSAKLIESETNQLWVYTDEASNDEIVIKPPRLSFTFEVTLKSSKGETVTANLKTGDIYFEDGPMRNGNIDLGNSYRSPLVRLQFEGYDASNPENDKELKIKILGTVPESSISGGECEVTVNYSVLNAVTEIKYPYITVNYYVGDELDLSDFLVNLTYFDGTEVTVGFDEILTMPQLEGSYAEGFDSSKAANNRPLNVYIKSAGITFSQTQLRYNVLENNETDA